MDIIFHYPPELMNLLIDTIPRLCRSYDDTLLLFQGAGVEFAIIADLWVLLKTDRKNINKAKIARTVLTRLNEQGEATLRERREILKRVTEFEDFSTCWPNDRLEAQGLVSRIQRVVNVKDSFTRINEERTQERKQHISQREAEADAARKRRDAIGRLKNELFALFGLADGSKRGKALEGILNRLFEACGILVRDAFTLTGECGEGVVEQIDGVIELDSDLYFVEMKWWKDAIGVPQISEHLVRIYHRSEARAIIISASEYTAPALATCKEALYKDKVVTLCTLREIVMLLECQGDLREFLRKKVQATILEKNPFPHVAVSGGV
jgi:restriction endonuclease Mrr